MMVNTYVTEKSRASVVRQPISEKILFAYFMRLCLKLLNLQINDSFFCHNHLYKGILIIKISTYKNEILTYSEYPSTVHTT